MAEAHRPACRNRGSVLVVVLLLCGAMAIPVAVALRSFVAGLRTAALFIDEMRAEELGRSGVDLAYGRLAGGQRALRTKAVYSFGQAEVAVNAVDESARVDLNSAAPALLAGLFVAVGVEPEPAAAYAGRIVQMRGSEDNPQAPNPGAPANPAAAMASAVKTVGSPTPAGAPRPPIPSGKGPFASTLELWNVLDIPPDVVVKVMPWLSVANGTDKINVLLADPLVLMAVPGMTAEKRIAILEARDREPERMEALIKQLGKGSDFVQQETGRGMRLAIRVTLHRTFVRWYEAVVTFDGDGSSRPYHIVSWQAVGGGG